MAMCLWCVSGHHLVVSATGADQTWILQDGYDFGPKQFQCDGFYCWAGTVRDPDGWTNVRSGPGGNHEVVGKVYENQFFWIDIEAYWSQSNADWVPIRVPRAPFYPFADPWEEQSKGHAGFVHRSRVFSLEQMVEQGPPPADQNFRFTVCSNDPGQRFGEVKADFNFKGFDSMPSDWWLTMHRGTPAQVDVFIGMDRYTMPAALVRDLRGCRGVDSVPVYRSGSAIVVHQQCGDAAGAYDVLWIFEDGQLVQRIAGGGEL